MPSNRYLILQTITISILFIASVTSVPISPCPRNFHYEYDGDEWIGVVKIYPRVYNSFRTNKIRMIIILLVNAHLMPGRVGSIEFYHSLTETYDKIGLNQPVVYRINFPIQAISPILLEILVNNVRVCSNPMQKQVMYGYSSRIQLQHTFYLPPKRNEASTQTFELINEQFLPSSPQLTFQPEVVSPLNPHTTRTDGLDDVHFSNGNDDWATCGLIDKTFQLTHLIMGGEKIARGTWPWLVAIFRKAVGGVAFLCTGILITHRIVLTAAHCFKLYDKDTARKSDELLLAFGRHNLRDWTEENVILSDADSIHIHPDYMQSEMEIIDADIAVIRTTKHIAYNAFVRPICLWPSTSSFVQNIEDIIDKTGTLVGWGQPRLVTGPNVPRKLEMSIVPTFKCYQQRTHEIRTFCGRSRNSDEGACNGDSGTGLALWQNGAWFLRGILSAAVGDPILNRCEVNRPIIFTDITRFRQWINTFIVFDMK